LVLRLPLIFPEVVALGEASGFAASCKFDDSNRGFSLVLGQWRKESNLHVITKDGGDSWRKFKSPLDSRRAFRKASFGINRIEC